MFPDDLGPEQKLTAGRRLFEQTLDTWSRWYSQMKRDFRFHSGGENQWDAQDLEVLREQRRPHLSFNLSSVVIREMIGAQEDAKREAKAIPVGEEDQFRAEIFNRLWRAIRRQTDADFADAEAFEKGCIGGVGFTVIDVNPRPGEPQWVDFVIDPIHPFEVMVDPGAQRRDLRDAQFVVWNKWMREGQFVQSYPELRTDVRMIFGEQEHALGMGFNEIPETSMEMSVQATSPVDLPGASEDALYFDKRRRLLRVLHYQYRKPVRRHYVINPQTGRSERIDDRAYRLFNQRTPFQFAEVWEEEIWWLEMIGTRILFDGPAPYPSRGFTIKTFVCDRDHLTGEPRGLLRDLIDPQKEINKRHSQTLDLLNKQTAPGLFAESDAFVDQDEAEGQMRTPGGIAWLKSGGMQKIQKREPPTFPAASAEMMDRAVQMFFRISGVNIDTLVGEHAGNEPATTALLRYRRSIMAITKHVQNYHAYQKHQLEAAIDLIVNVVPDAQIEAMLGNPVRWRVIEGVVYDLETGQQAEITGLADVEWDVELDVAAANTTIALLQLRIMLEMSQIGVPMDPIVMVDQLPVSRDKRNRLVRHIESLQKAQAEAQQQQIQLEAQNLQTEQAFAQIEAQINQGELDEKVRHNLQLEALQALRTERDFLAKLAAVWEKADTAEKQALLQVLGRFIDAASRKQAAGPSIAA